jgi:hypothetical protein
MAEADITYLLVIGILALIFTFVCIIWRGLIVFGMLSGAMWAMVAFFFVQRTQEGVVIMEFQEYFQLLMLGLSIAMFFSPLWLKAKSMTLEDNAPDDINIWGKEDKWEEDLSEYGIHKKDSKSRRR